jgi:hypothetical protein
MPAARQRASSSGEWIVIGGARCRGSDTLRDPSDREYPSPLAVLDRNDDSPEADGNADTTRAS